MKRFMTLLWLEYRRSWVWGAALIGSLAFWAWGLNQVNVRDIGEQLGIRAGLLGIAAALGGLVLCFMFGRIRSETRQGQYQILLLTPPAGYVHVAARYVFALAVAVLYFVGIGGLAWWIVGQTGLSLDARTVAQLVVVCPFYGIGAVLIPLLAWTLLLMIFVSAYRISNGQLHRYAPIVLILVASDFQLPCRSSPKLILELVFQYIPFFQVYHAGTETTSPATHSVIVATGIWIECSENLLQGKHLFGRRL